MNASAHAGVEREPLIRLILLDDNPLVRQMLRCVAARRQDVVLEAFGTPDMLRVRMKHRGPVDLIACDHDLAGLGAGATCEPLVSELVQLGHHVVVLTDDRRAVRTALAPNVTVLERPVALHELLDLARALRRTT